MSLKKAWLPLLAAVLLLIAGILYIHFTHYAPLKVEEGTEVEVWYANDDALWQRFASLVESFNIHDGEKYGFKVVPKIFSDAAELYAAVDDCIKNNSKLPDMLICDMDYAADLYEKDCLAPLDDYFGQWELSYVDEKYSGAAKYNDALVAVPVAANTGVFMVNSTVFLSDADVGTFESLCKTADEYYAENEKSFYTLSDYSQFFRTALSQYADAFDGVSPHDTKNVNCKNVYKLLAANAYNRSFMATGSDAASFVAKAELPCAVLSSSEVMKYRHLMNDADISFLLYPCETVGTPVCTESLLGITMTSGSENSMNACAMFIRWFSSDETNRTFVGDSGYLSAAGVMTAESEDAVYLKLRDAVMLHQTAGERLVFAPDPQYSQNSRSFDSILKTIMNSFA